MVAIAIFRRVAPKPLASVIDDLGNRMLSRRATSANCPEMCDRFLNGNSQSRAIGLPESTGSKSSRWAIRDGNRPRHRTHPTRVILSDAWYFAKRVTLSLALRLSGDAGRGFGRVGAAAALVAGRQGADRRGNVGSGRQGDRCCGPQRCRGQRRVHLAPPGPDVSIVINPKRTGAIRTLPVHRTFKTVWLPEQF